MTHVIDPQDGAHLLCCWGPCERYGHHEHRARVREPLRTVWYVFCTERHRMFWVNSHRDHLNLPAGSKGLLS